jgi:serine/threonine-protein kinase
VSPFPYLKYYGTYGTRNDDAAGNHVPDMAGIANLHWINVSPTDPAQPVTYRTNVFASCPPKSCIVYVGSEDNTVYALNVAPSAANRVHWRYTTGGGIISNPSLAVAGSTVYVGSQDDKLYALGALTSAPRWTPYLTGASVDSRPVVAGGTVYVGSDDNKVYALDTANGNRRWATPIGDFAVSGPAVAGDTVYVGSGNGEVYALNVANGDIRWHYKTANSIFSSPVVAGNIVYIGSEDGKVYAFNVVS